MAVLSQVLIPLEEMCGLTLVEYELFEFVFE